MWIAPAASVSPHSAARQAMRKTPCEAIRKAGVAVPAISRKIIAWSTRCSLTRHVSLQLPRW